MQLNIQEEDSIINELENSPTSRLNQMPPILKYEYNKIG